MCVCVCMYICVTYVLPIECCNPRLVLPANQRAKAYAAWALSAGRNKVTSAQQGCGTARAGTTSVCGE